MILWIVILLLFIVSLVAAYFGARYWHWAHVTIVVLIFLAAVGYLLLAAETLRINAVLRKQANQLETQLAEVQVNLEALERGTKSGQVISRLNGLPGTAEGEVLQLPEDIEELPSITDVKHQLFLATRLRGRVWRKVTPGQFDPQTGTVDVSVESPQPSGIEQGRVLFAFEQGKPALPDPTQGAQYLGEFRVTKADAQQATLVSVNELDKVERERLANSRGPWALYETMPVDQLELFAGLDEKQLRKLLPAASVEEYIRQGTPAGPDDDEWHVIGFDDNGNQVGPDNMDKAVKKVYQRRLRDYAADFAELNERRVMLLANIAAVSKDIERLQAAQVSAKKLEAFRTDEVQKLKIDLAGVEKERAIIEAHQAQVEQQLATARKLLDQAIAENRRLADELARREAPATPRSGNAETPPTPLAVSR